MNYKVYCSDDCIIPNDASLQSALTLRDGRMFWTMCRAQHFTIMEYLQKTENFNASDVVSAGWLQDGIYREDESGYSMECIRGSYGSR